MIASLIRIRFRQLGREIQIIGFFQSMLLMLVLLPLLAFYLFKILDKPGTNSAIVAVAAVLIFLLHLRRKDHNFLTKLSDNPFRIYFTEYLILSSPFLLLLLFKLLLIHAAALVVSLIFIALMTPRRKNEKTYQYLIKYIPENRFEWQSGIRKNLIVFIIIYPIGALGILNIWFTAAAAFFLALVISTFYSECEPVRMLEASEKRPMQFLSSKLQDHTRLFIISLLPLILIACTHYGQILWIILVLLVILNFLIAAILLKYAYYIPGNTSGAHQFFCSVLLMASIILPFSLLILLLNIMLFKKSLRTLNQHLNA